MSVPMLIVPANFKEAYETKNRDGKWNSLAEKRECDEINDVYVEAQRVCDEITNCADMLRKMDESQGDLKRGTPGSVIVQKKDFEGELDYNPKSKGKDSIEFFNAVKLDAEGDRDTEYNVTKGTALSGLRGEARAWESPGNTIFQKTEYVWEPHRTRTITTKTVSIRPDGQISLDIKEDSIPRWMTDKLY
ncbi:MAG: hypothetical protein AB9903_10515 [Vulcanimicrobiota bacterium]